MLKNSNTIPCQFHVANEIAKKYSDSHNFVTVCSCITKHFHDVPLSYDEDQMAHSLSLNVYNCLQACLCMCFDGIENIELLELVEMTESEKAAVLHLYNQVAPRIKTIVEKQKRISEIRRAVGKKGGRPRKNQSAETPSIDIKNQFGFSKEQNDGLNTCNIENNVKTNLVSETISGKGGYIRGIGEKRVYRRSLSYREKGLQGEKGLDPLPPYIPPEEFSEKEKQEIVENAVSKSGSAPDEKTEFEIRSQIKEKRPDLTPRRKWQKRSSHFVTDLGVTWEAFRNVEAVVALTTIPCPSDFDTWLPLVISAKRGNVPDEVIDAWSRTGGHYDHDENQYYLDYAKKERAGGITVLLLFKVYNHGFDCVGRFSHILKSEMTHNRAFYGKTASDHANTLPSSKNAVAASGHAVVRPSERNLLIEAPLSEPETEFSIAKPQTEAKPEPSSKPVAELIPQTPPANGEPTVEEKRKVLEDYMIGERGFDWDTISYFGDDAKWDPYRKSWYISIQEDGYETKRYLDVPPDCNAKDKLRHPRYIVTKNSGLKNHKREHMFEKDNEVVFLVEGQFDVRALKCAGYLGVGVKKPDQLEEDLRNPNLTAMHFIIVCDSDETGHSNARKWSDILEDNGFTSHVCHLPEGFADVSAMLKAQGRVAVMEYIEDFMVKEGITGPIIGQPEDNPYLDDSWV